LDANIVDIQLDDVLLRNQNVDVVVHD
jgi:hypothetical protein